MNCQFCCPQRSVESDAKRQSFSDQLDHIRIDHLDVYKPYKCDKCNASWSTEKSFNDHNRQQHRNESMEIMIPSKYLDVLGRVMMKCNMNKTFKQQQTVKQLIEFVKQSTPLPVIDQSATRTIQKNVEQSVPMVQSIMQNSQAINAEKEIDVIEIPTTSNLRPQASIDDLCQLRPPKRSLMDNTESFSAAGSLHGSDMMSNSSLETNPIQLSLPPQPIGYAIGQVVQPGAEVYVRNGDHYVRCMYMGLSSSTNTNNENQQKRQQHKSLEHEFICGLCGFVSVSQFGLRVHVRKHGSLASVCPHCNQVCTTATELQVHLLNHRVVCVRCKRIEAHIELPQQDQNARGAYRCKSCQESMKKEYRCRTCNLLFCSLSELEQHNNTHYR